MRVGDQVTVSHGLPPAGSDRAVVIADHGETLSVRFQGGGVLKVARHHVVESAEPPSRIKMRDHHWRVLGALYEAGPRGLTDFEYPALIGLKQTSAGVRRHELEKAELVEWTGSKRGSDTHTPSKVYRTTRAGEALWRAHRDAKGAA